MSRSPAPLFTLRLLTGEPVEMAALEAIFEAAPRYFEAVCGTPPSAAEAQIVLEKPLLR